MNKVRFMLMLFVPLVWLFAQYFGVNHVWCSVWISEAVAVVFAVWASYREIHKKVDFFEI